MAQAHPKRFYKQVSVVADEAAYLIHLDGRTLKTPGKHTLYVPNAHVADLIAHEWDAQDEHIKPETMPVTRLVNVATELTPSNRPKLINEATSYAATDLLSYRASDPAELTERQAKLWDPVLNWAKDQGFDLIATRTIIAVEQKPTSLEAVTTYAASLDDLHLTLLVHLTAVFGSAILAIAVMKQHLSGSQAFELSRLDAIWQIEHWGEDDEAREKTEALAIEVNALCKILGA